MITYIVIDRHTQKAVGKPYKSKARARTRVDTLDNAYGAYRYAISTSEGQSAL
jgi:hypothetical protein